jgi:predicted DCC family thiol-disulfide oxidoreductase YuxK
MTGLPELTADGQRSTSGPVSASSEPYDIEVFFDGDCPLCAREIRLLRRLDRRRRIVFTDIAAPAFDPAPLGLTQERLVDRIHGRLPSGSLVDGVEVFRRLYTAVGWGVLADASRVPGVRQLLDWLYTLFAKNRLRLTGRCSADSCELPRR